MEQELSRTVYWVVTSWSGSVWANKTEVRVNDFDSIRRLCIRSEAPPEFWTAKTRTNVLDVRVLCHRTSSARRLGGQTRAQGFSSAHLLEFRLDVVAESASKAGHDFAIVLVLNPACSQPQSVSAL